MADQNKQSRRGDKADDAGASASKARAAPEDDLPFSFSVAEDEGEDTPRGKPPAADTDSPDIDSADAESPARADGHDDDGTPPAEGSGDGAAAAGTPALASVGQRLRRAREALGLDLAAIADKTCIPLRHLQALEDDAHASLPALVYSVGFLRTYAGLLHLDVENVIASFRRETDKSDPAPRYSAPVEASGLPSKSTLFFSALALVLVIVAFWFYASHVSSPHVSFTPAPQDSVGHGPASVTPAPLSVRDVSDGAALQAAQADQIASAHDAASPPPASPPADGAAPAALPPAIDKGVVIRAVQETWLRVYRKDGRIVFERILPQGEYYQVPSTAEPLYLWVGRAGGVQLMLDGQDVPPLGSANKVIRDFDLSPAALRDFIRKQASAPAAPAPVSPPSTPSSSDAPGADHTPASTG